MRHPALNRHVQHLAENHAIWMLENIGYTLYPSGCPEHSGLIIDGKLRIEVKGALWSSSSTRQGRYQFNTRQHPDVYVLRILEEPGADFVIPGREIGERKNIAIWSRNPHKYNGQWSKYLNRWDVIEAELERKAHDENPD